MNLQKPATVFSLILLSGAILSGFAIQDVAFAQQRQGMALSITADEGSTTISVSGTTSKRSEGVAITVTGPIFGNLISIDQILPDANGDFMTEIQVGGKQWKQDGVYTISAFQGDKTLYNISLPVEIVGGTTLATAVSESSLISLTSPSSISGKPGLNIEADFVWGSTTIDITGQTDRTNTEIAIVITAPNGNIISIDQLTPNVDGSFMTNVQTGGQLWGQDGFYTIAAQQGSSLTHLDTVQVDIVDGTVIPEFGTIAAMILSVAIISIIAVTAKTRLSLVPKQ